MQNRAHRLASGADWGTRRYSMHCRQHSACKRSQPVSVPRDQQSKPMKMRDHLATEHLLRAGRLID